MTAASVRVSGVSAADRTLDALYARVPDMDGCDGSCWRSCGPVPMSRRERQRITEAGVTVPPLLDAMVSGGMCPALSPFGRCTVYPIRPLLCRLWGAVEGMRCEYGCTPRGGYLTDEEARRLIVAAARAGGGMAS